MIAWMELVQDENIFEKMWLDVGSLEIFGTFISFCVVYFSTLLNWRYKSYNTIISDILSESSEALDMLLL